MVHKASTLVSIQAAAKAAGVKVLLEGGQNTQDDYGRHAEVVRPVLLGRVTPDTKVVVDWDGKGATEIALATTEFFMPILVTMETASFDDFIRFCLVKNPHDLAVSIWTRDDAKLVPRAAYARRDAEGERRDRQRARVGGVRRERRRRQRQHGGRGRGNYDRDVLAKTKGAALRLLRPTLVPSA